MQPTRMAQRPHRLAIASFQTLDVALGVKAALVASGLAEDGIVMLAHLDIFTTSRSTAPGEVSELPLLQSAAQIYCMVGPLAATLSLNAHASRSLEEFLGRWLLPRPGKQIASHVEKGNIAIGVQLNNSEEEQAACRILLAQASSRLEVHDVACDDCRPPPSLY